MSLRKRMPGIGLWLSCGGLTVLAAHHWLTVYEPELSIDNLVLLAGGLSGYLVTALGIFLSAGYWNHVWASRTGAERDVALSQPNGAVPEDGQVVLGRGEVIRRMAGSFLAWCEQDHPTGQLWNAFDQLVREMLTEHLGAARVRCYQVLPGDHQYRSLSLLGTPDEAKCARDGMLGRVAITGREYVAADAADPEQAADLAADAAEPWEWIYPIREEAQTVGLVAIGKLAPSIVLDSRRREGLATMITIFWKHVARLERLGIAERTDKASGMLTRSDFFALATRALVESYAENEPVAVVVLAVEGLRWLDDTGRWSDHDALVESIGQLAKRRMRTDDIIGRFSEDRFVLLLRRLDSSLGRLIAAKTQDTAQRQLEQFGNVGDALHVRAGLAGSGTLKPSLEELLVAAFDAAEQARKQNIALYCASGGTKPPGPPSPLENPLPQTTRPSATS